MKMQKKMQNDHKRSIANRERMIAFHCSGGSDKQWRPLTNAFSGCFDIVTPTNSTCSRVQQSHLGSNFTLADEAAQTLKQIKTIDSCVHLVGHSFGGAVALYIATQVPDQIASLTLYEPASFHVLRHDNPDTREGFKEINAFKTQLGNDVSAGKLQQAARRFVEFWNGEQSWSSLPDSIKTLLIQWAQYCPAEFSACFDHDTPLDRYADLSMPVLLMRGQHAKTAINSVVHVLDDTLANSNIVEVQGAGHMGPITHAREVIDHFTDFIFDVQDMRFEQPMRRAA